MEGERGEVGYFAAHEPVAHGTEGVGGVGYHDAATKDALDVVGGTEEVAPGLDCGEDFVVVGYDAGEIDGHYGFSALGDGEGKLVVVHLEEPGCAVDHHRARADVAYGACGGGVGVGGDDYFVALSDAEHAEGEFHASGGGVEAACSVLRVPSGLYLAVWQHMEIRCSNSLVRGPVVIHPDFMASATSKISASVISGGENGMFLLTFIFSMFGLVS